MDDKRLLFDKNTQAFFNSVPEDEYTYPEKHKESGFIEFVCQLDGPIKILDIGCGKGDFLNLIRDVRPDIQSVGMDISIGMLLFSKINLKVLGSILLPPFKDKTFDIVHLDATIHHLVGTSRYESMLNVLECFKKAASILKDGGYILIGEPIYEPYLANSIVFYLKQAVSYVVRNKRVWMLGSPVVSMYTEGQILDMLHTTKMKVHSCYFKPWPIQFILKLLFRKRGRLYVIAKKEG